jgi:hypothetical protein
MSSHHPLRTNSVTYCSTPFELRMCAGQSKTAAKSDVDNVDVEGKCPTSNIVAACPQAHPILVGNKTGGRKKLKTHTRSWPKGKKRNLVRATQALSRTAHLPRTPPAGAQPPAAGTMTFNSPHVTNALAFRIAATRAATTC